VIKQLDCWLCLFLILLHVSEHSCIEVPSHALKHDKLHASARMCPHTAACLDCGLILQTCAIIDSDERVLPILQGFHRLASSELVDIATWSTAHCGAVVAVAGRNR